MTPLFLKSFFIGFVMAMPIGPIGLLCIRRSLMHGLLYGAMVGIGAAAGDAFYASIAGFSYNYLATVFLQHKVIFTIISSFILMYLGIKIYASKPSLSESVPDGRGLANTIITTFLLTVTSPVTVIAFLALYTMVGQICTGWQIAVPLTIGVFLGSCIWYVLLASVISLVRKRVTAAMLEAINKLTGIGLLLFSIGAVITLFR